MILDKKISMKGGHNMRDILRLHPWLRDFLGSEKEYIQYLEYYDLYKKANELWEKRLKNKRKIKKDALNYRRYHSYKTALIALMLFDDKEKKGSDEHRKILFFASLVHDIKKHGRKSHNKQGAKYVNKNNEDIIKIDNKQIKKICNLIKHHNSKDEDINNNKLKELIAILKKADKYSKKDLIKSNKDIKRLYSILNECTIRKKSRQEE